MPKQLIQQQASRYRKIGNISSPTCGNTLENADPLSYCVATELDNLTLHGSAAAGLLPGSKQCQAYMADYCAENWDGFCDIYAMNNRKIPVENISGLKNFCLDESPFQTGCNTVKTVGENMIYHAAIRKYLVNMDNCQIKQEQFDPSSPVSPLVRYFSPTNGISCVPTYRIDPAKIDSDPIMNSLLEKIHIGPDVLLGIYNQYKQAGTLTSLSGTKLGAFYNSNRYFKMRGGLSA